MVKSFFSASVPCPFPSSLMNNRPGPQVGKLASAQIIFPPVCSKADKAAFIAGNSAGSGFLMCENRVGICVNSDEMTCLRPVSMVK